jgi:hypothetical protein
MCTGRACFIVEVDPDTRPLRGSDAHDPSTCSKCTPVVSIDASNGQRVLEHMGGHVLFDPALRDLQGCGLCLRPFPICTFYFKKSRGTSAARQIDWTRSQCGNPTSFNMATASVSKESSPCSNIPVQCSLCDAAGPLIWTYNLASHYRERHSRPAGPFTYKPTNKGPQVEYITSRQELKWMQAKWDKRFDVAKPRNLKEKVQRRPLFISEAHSSRMALQCVLQSFCQIA